MARVLAHPERIAAIAAVLVLLTGIVAASTRGGAAKADLVLGAVSTEEPTPDPTAPPTARPTPGLLEATGYGPGGPLPWRGAVDVPDDLKFFLVIGSDARRGQNVTRARADSIHIAALDPRTMKGTILGLPRDTYVGIPGYGPRKINSALPLGGPELLARTVRGVTGLPISHYAVTGFAGMEEMVDELGGLDVKVPYTMRDRFSGSRFKPGWHRMDGKQVLAFTRARYNVPGGDVGRSENHGRVMVHALEKLRATTSDVGGIRRWLGVLFDHATVDMPLGEAVELGILARQVRPSDLRNVVAPGTPQFAGGQSVIVLRESAFDLFKDVGADAVADGNRERGATAERAEPRRDRPSGTPEPDDEPEPTRRPSPSPRRTAKPGSSPTPTPRPLLPL